MGREGVRGREESGDVRGYLISLSVKTYLVISRLSAATQSTMLGVSPRAVT